MVTRPGDIHQEICSNMGIEAGNHGWMVGVVRTSWGWSTNPWTQKSFPEPTSSFGDERSRALLVCCFGHQSQHERTQSVSLFESFWYFLKILYISIFIYILYYIYRVLWYMSIHVFAFSSAFSIFGRAFCPWDFFSMSMIRRLLDAVERSGSTTTISLSSSPCSAWRKKQKGAREITEFCGHLIYFDIIWFIWCFNRIQVWNKLIFFSGRTAKPFFPFDFRIFTHWKGPCQAESHSISPGNSVSTKSTAPGPILRVFFHSCTSILTIIWP